MSDDILDRLEAETNVVRLILELAKSDQYLGDAQSLASAMTVLQSTDTFDFTTINEYTLYVRDIKEKPTDSLKDQALVFQKDILKDLENAQHQLTSHGIKV